MSSNRGNKLRKSSSNGSAQPPPPIDDLTPPRTIAEICDGAELSLQGRWDPHQPLKVYVQATRQLFQESKVYKAEGDYDTAFHNCIIIEKLTTDLIPNRHPEWHNLSPEMKQQIRRGAGVVGVQISDLKKLIFQRGEDWERARKASGRASPTPSTVRSTSPTPSQVSSTASYSTAPGSTPALTLRNTVTPALGTMSSTPSLSAGHSDDFLAKHGAPPGKDRKGKLKKMFGVGKEKKSSSSAPTSAPLLVEPGTKVDVEDDKIQEEWDMVDEVQKSKEREKELPEVVLHPPRRTAVSSSSWRLPRPPSMPLPGDDEEYEEEDQFPGPSQRMSAPPLWNSAQPSLPPSLYASNNSPIPSPQIVYNAPVGSANGPRPGWTPALYQHQQNTFRQRSPLPSPPVPSSSSSSQQYWPTSSPYETVAASLQRTPSRLTVSHQQQQGFTPSSELASAPITQYSNQPQQLYSPYPVATRPSGVVPPSNSAYGPYAPATPQYSTPYLTQPHQPPYPPPLQIPPIIPLSSPLPSPSYAQTPPSHPSYHHGITAPPAPRRPNLPQPPPTLPPPTTSSLSDPNQTPLQPPYPSSSAYQDTSPSAPPAQPQSLGLTRTMSLSALPRDRQPRRSSTIREEGKLAVGGAFAMDSLAEVLEEELSRTEGGQVLRNLLLPIEVISRFVGLARDNSEKGIETCGLLMGTLSHDLFTITNLLIPKQEGTTDTCMTTHEEEQFAFQDERDLMTLGWIHTHPTQSCFMSSLDLHTHASYQVMLAEAIAIVCAPKSEPSFGIFRLTDPPGLETIVKCNIPGMFHPHPDLPIYTDTDHGHVQLRENLDFECHDLRTRK